MLIKELFANLNIESYALNNNISISDLETNSKSVKQRCLFIALKGTKVDGNQYIDDAVKNGAVAILTDDLQVARNKNCFYTKDCAAIIAILAKRFYHQKPKNIIAITGTNGKTSTAYFCYQLGMLVGRKSGYIGTIGAMANGIRIAVDNNLTTPSIVELHKLLCQMAQMGVDFVALEASSHGIDQGRLAEILLDAASFTNISPEHLDYHHNMDEYFAAKKKLFTDLLLDNKTIIANKASDKFSNLADIAAQKKCKIISYGTEDSDLSIESYECNNRGITASIKIFGHKISTSFKFLGKFQLENILCAIANLLTIGVKLEEIIPVLDKISPPPGRMQLVANENFASVIIDYAHKPVALETVLKEVRHHISANGQIWVVFGCGGERDTTKRKTMGEIADQYADYVIITDDNPRNEDPVSIRNEIARYCNKALIIPDRKSAIKYTIMNAKKEDIILIAGKGHENYQIIGNNKIHFSDLECVQEIISQ